MLHVVPDLNEVVELHTVFNHRVLQSSTIDARVGADFHIVTNAHGPQLFDLDPSPLVGSKAKTVCADDHPRMQQATRTDLAVFAQRDPGREHRAFTYHSAAFDHAQRPDSRRRVNLRRGIYHRTGVNPRATRRRVPLLPKLRDPCEVHVGVVHHNACATRQGSIAHGGRHNDTGRL